MHVLASALVHLAVLLTLGLTYREDHRQPTKNSLGTTIEIAKPEGMVRSGGDLAASLTTNIADKSYECYGDKWYGGLGITVDLSNGVILEVHKGYAADLEGLNPGDKLLDYGYVDVTGDPGTEVTLQVETSKGLRLTKKFVRSKVCIYEKLED